MPNAGPMRATLAAVLAEYWEATKEAREDSAAWRQHEDHVSTEIKARMFHIYDREMCVAVEDSKGRPLVLV